MLGWRCGIFLRLNPLQFKDLLENSTCGMPPFGNQYLTDALEDSLANEGVIVHAIPLIQYF